jgi:hypothetical protein
MADRPSPKTFRLATEERERLAALAKELDCSEADVVRWGLASLYGLLHARGLRDWVSDGTPRLLVLRGAAEGRSLALFEADWGSLFEWDNDYQAPAAESEHDRAVREREAEHDYRRATVEARIRKVSEAQGTTLEDVLLAWRPEIRKWWNPKRSCFEFHTITTAPMRAKRRARAKAVLAPVREEGWTYQAIADALGVAKSSIHSVLNEN